MGLRLDLHTTLVEILGSPDVYFQPPSNVEMKYPCIVYERDDADTKFAGNKPYLVTPRYQVTVIDPNPDSDIPKRLAALEQCRFLRFFAVGHLNHDVYILYF